jgi:hypothetical protein
MIDKATLDRAVSAGILDAAQRTALLEMAGGDGHSSSRTSTQTNTDTGVLSVDDQMRLVGGGNDIFVTVGIVLLFSGALFALQAVLPPNSMLLAVLLAAGSWLVAEIVTRQKRMRLSSTLLALVFSAAVLTLFGDISICTTANATRSGRTAPSGFMSSPRRCWCIRCSSCPPARTWSLARSSRASALASCLAC